MFFVLRVFLVAKAVFFVPAADFCGQSKIRAIREGIRGQKKCISC